MSQTDDQKPVEQKEEDCEYRKELSSLEHASQEKYDQVAMTEPGEALGSCFTFLKDLVDLDQIILWSCLWLAWLSRGFSVKAVLFSLFNQRALRTAITQVDKGTHRFKPLGGKDDKWTGFLYGTGGVLFITGVVLFVISTTQNMRHNIAQKDSIPSHGIRTTSEPKQKNLVQRVPPLLSIPKSK